MPVSPTEQSAYARSVFRPNLVGDAYQRQKVYQRDYEDVYNRGESSSSSALGLRRTEFEVLKEKHRFLRDEEASSSKNSWEEALAAKYESSLFKEFAVCDLKHYKSGNFSLRWRTEDEVVSGAGQDTCGNTRCAYHQPVEQRQMPRLVTLEVPFAYMEQGKLKSALVKLVLCERCQEKLSWKRRKDRDEDEVTKTLEDDGAAGMDGAKRDDRAGGGRAAKRARTERSSESKGRKHSSRGKDLDDVPPDLDAGVAALGGTRASHGRSSDFSSRGRVYSDDRRSSLDPRRSNITNLREERR